MQSGRFCHVFQPVDVPGGMRMRYIDLWFIEPVNFCVEGKEWKIARHCERQAQAC